MCPDPVTRGRMPAFGTTFQDRVSVMFLLPLRPFPSSKKKYFDFISFKDNFGLSPRRMILSHSTTWFKALLLVEYSADRYMNNCLTFQSNIGCKSAFISNMRNPRSLFSLGPVKSSTFSSVTLETWMLTGTTRSLNAVVMKQPKVRAAITLSEKAKREFALDSAVFIVLGTGQSRHGGEAAAAGGQLLSPRNEPQQAE